MRRLLLLISVLVLIETTFFAALAPLIPEFTDEFGLTKWQAGLLVAAYALGSLIGAIPAGLLASRAGVRPTTVLALVLVAGASVAFGLVDHYWLLFAARLAQGLGGGAFLWTAGFAWLVSTAPRERRGETIGFAMSAAIGGVLLGPVLGGAASHFGRAPVFAAVAGLCLALIPLTLRLPSPPKGEGQPVRRLLDALRSRRVLVGMWLLTLTSLLFGTLGVLAPLQLDRLGWGVLGVAGTFFLSAGVEVLLNPLVGRWSDRRGRLAPVRVSLVAAAAVTLVIPWVGERFLLSAVIVLAGAAFGAFWTPATALLSDGWEDAGVEHGLGFVLMNFAWAPGHMLGSAAGGAVAGAAGDIVAYSLLAGLCALTLAALKRRRVAAVAAAVRARVAEPG